MVFVQVAVGHLSGFQLNQLLPVASINIPVVGGGKVSLCPVDPISDGLQAASHHVLPPLHLMLLILYCVMLCHQALMIANLQHQQRRGEHKDSRQQSAVRVNWHCRTLRNDKHMSASVAKFLPAFLYQHHMSLCQGWSLQKHSNALLCKLNAGSAVQAATIDTLFAYAGKSSKQLKAAKLWRCQTILSNMNQHLFAKPTKTRAECDKEMQRPIKQSA